MGLLPQPVEAVSMHPLNRAVGNAVYCRIVLGARNCLVVLLDGDDALPSPGAGKGDGVAAGASEKIKKDVAMRRRTEGKTLCDSAFFLK